MMTHGTFFAAPQKLLIYRYINPFYLRKVIPKVMPWFTSNFTRWKRVLSSIVVDTTVLNVPVSALSLGFVGMIDHKGNVFDAAN